MKNAGRQNERKALTVLKSCLAKAPFISINFIKNLNGDFLIRLSTPSGPREMIVEVKGNGQPRIVREAVFRLLHLLKKRPAAYGIIVAPYISPKAADICAKENIGFADFAGNCRLCFESVLIEQSGRPNSSVVRRGQRSLFAQKAMRILRVLLMNPKKKWRIANLAKEAGVSLGQAFNVKKLLLDREWLITNEEGIFISDPESLFREWTKSYSYRENQVLEFFTLKSPAELEADIAKYCTEGKIPYALTGFSAALRYAPIVRSNRVMAYISGDMEEIASVLGLKEVTSGANVLFMIPRDDSVYYGLEDVEGIKIVSPLQACLDLATFRGRGEEAAEMILERKVRPSW